jgi:hypothetical protein
MAALRWFLFALWYISGIIWDIRSVTEYRPYRVVDILGTAVLAFAGPAWPTAVYLQRCSQKVLFNKR